MAAALTLAGTARAGGGPLAVVVLYNADVSAAVRVAELYRDTRQIPSRQLCGVSGLKESDATIDVSTFKTKIQAPLDNCIGALPHPERVDYVVLVRGLPYAVTLPTYGVALQAAIQVRHAKRASDGAELAGLGQPGNDSASVANPLYPMGSAPGSDYTIDNPFKSWYSAASRVTRAIDQPRAFHARNAPAMDGWAWANNLVIVSSLDGFDYTDATELVVRGSKSDGTFPKADLLCMKGADDARGARDPECEYTTRMLAAAGLGGAWVPTFDGKLSGRTLAGYMTGAADLREAIAGNTYVPGAIACNLTSFGAAIPNFACAADGGACPANENQTSFARFVRAGATGAHGTVLEPKNNVFPNAGTLLHYTFGYSMGESFLFNQRYLYWQSIYLGDPLAAPYAERPTVTLDVPREAPEGSLITARATHPAGIASIALFEDGRLAAEAEDATVTHPIRRGVEVVLAVAIARDAPATRAGWPNPNQRPHPEIEGWRSARVKVSAAPPPGDGPADGGATDAASPASPGESGGCACGVTPARAEATWAAWVIGALSALAGARRSARRRGGR